MWKWPKQVIDLCWAVLITKPDLPSVASGCIYQTRGRISVLHVLQRKILRLWVFTNRCLQLLFTSFVLFCHWLLLSLLCQIPDAQQRRTHIFLPSFQFSAHVQVQTARQRLHSLGLWVLCLKIQFALTKMLQLDCVCGWKSESAIHRWRILQGLKSEFQLLPHVGGNVCVCVCSLCVCVLSTFFPRMYSCSFAYTNPKKERKNLKKQEAAGIQSVCVCRFRLWVMWIASNL